MDLAVGDDLIPVFLRSDRPPGGYDPGFSPSARPLALTSGGFYLPVVSFFSCPGSVPWTSVRFSVDVLKRPLDRPNYWDFQPVCEAIPNTCQRTSPNKSFNG